MALPLIWIGAAAVVAYSGIKNSHKISPQKGFVQAFPGGSDAPVEPKNGAILCCEVYNVLEHTGIWVDDRIIELNGNGLVRAITPERFLAERSGNKIFIACDEYHEPLVTSGTDSRAVNNVYQYREYDLLKNNCHRFVWEMVSGERVDIFRFSDLNQNLSRLHDSIVTWDVLNIQKNIVKL